MLDKEDRLKLKQQEREFEQKARENRADLKKLKVEQKEAKKGQRKKLRISRQAEKEEKAERPVSTNKILSVFPIRDYLESEEYFLTGDKTIINLFQIQGKSYYDASDDEIENLVCSNARLLQRLADDIKIISMNYPTNTKKQQEYITYMLNKPGLEPYAELLTEKLESLKALEQDTTDRQAFLMVFAKDKGRYQEITRLLSGNSYFVVRPISREKKENIIFQLNNMNKRVKV
jgi:hypothetical protein